MSLRRAMLYRKPQESSLDRLEREANDDFRLLAELGPAEFAFEHLLELRERARRRLYLFDRQQRIAMWMGAAAAGWVVLTFVAGAFQYLWLMLAAGAVGTINFFAFFFLIVLQKKRFDSRGELEFTLRSIEDELRRRGERQRKTNH
ncbi:MAG: hypothetical protein IT259_19740 [Saprospiraceae bacterium]|nr:hypothetical protein [Saprospiraceae bacterium]